MSAIPPPAPSGSQPDPSMEDILASIRRILSEDEQTGGAALDAVLTLDESMLVADPDSGSQPAIDEEKAILAAMRDITAVDPPVVDLPVMVPMPVAVPMPVMVPMPVAVPVPVAMAAAAQPAAAPPRLAAPPTDNLITPEAEAVTAQAMTTLMRTLEAGREPPADAPIAVYRGGPTLEDIVREELRAQLKVWLDSNLPPMVERLVRAEIARVVGRAVG